MKLARYAQFDCFSFQKYMFCGLEMGFPYVLQYKILLITLAGIIQTLAHAQQKPWDTFLRELDFWLLPPLRGQHTNLDLCYCDSCPGLFAELYEANMIEIFRWMGTSL